MADHRSFYEKVYDVVREIPRGRVSTYGAIARYLGTGRSARLVGYAMNCSHDIFPPVPAHRVVNRNGYLTGKKHFFSETMMQELLENEGVMIENDQVCDFTSLYWDPARNL